MFEEKPLYTIKELSFRYGGPLPVSVSTIYKACRTGEIRFVQICGRKLIPLDAVKKILYPEAS
ncbi:MAG: helix-turn-helix domain-containing protein [Enterococcus sp.]|nr:helix-turn-helix domain-containing protein [Enterococcus sp.]